MFFGGLIGQENYKYLKAITSSAEAKAWLQKHRNLLAPYTK